MNLTLIVTKNCNSCKRVETQLKEFAERDNINLIITDLNDSKRRGIIIVPALFINDDLFSYGDVDETKLKSELKNIKIKSTED
jgi:predicted thioredoxin/glutaredoxin